MFSRKRSESAHALSTWLKAPGPMREIGALCQAPPWPPGKFGGKSMALGRHAPQEHATLSPAVMAVRDGD